MLKGKKIIIGVTGSIAAYKSALLIRQFIKEGATVKVVMTPASKEFITPLTLSTLSQHPVHSEFFGAQTGEWHSHVDMGLWADAMIIAPASANTIGKMANGICDNLLLAVYMSAKCPVYIAPAMDLDMYKHPANTANISRLSGFGHKIIQAAYGELASGLIGEGRMAEPEEIVTCLREDFAKEGPMKGKKVLVTTGPTYESIDPVRFIGNHSTGKMGFAIANELAARGADVHLISGPTSQVAGYKSIKLTKVQSAEQMHEACTSVFTDMDYAVLAAAVADYKPSETSAVKIKKSNDDMQIRLVKTHDIAAALGGLKKSDQKVVGFALETNDEEAHAKGKLVSKNFDMIVLNSLNDQGAGFGHDTNKITIINHKESKRFELKSKKGVAIDIVNAMLAL